MNEVIGCLLFGLKFIKKTKKYEAARKCSIMKGIFIGLKLAYVDT
jgi:hypothetical protein